MTARSDGELHSLYTGKPMGERPDSFNTASDLSPLVLSLVISRSFQHWHQRWSGGTATWPVLCRMAPTSSPTVVWCSVRRECYWSTRLSNGLPPSPPPAAAPSEVVDQPPCSHHYASIGYTLPPAAGGAAGTQVTSRRNQGMRILSAREQVEMLSPWLIEAGPRKAPLTRCVVKAKSLTTSSSSP